MPGNPLHNALRKCLSDLPPELLTSLNLTIDTLASTPKTFSIYEPLLLLPAHAFTSPPWALLVKTWDSAIKTAFFVQLARSMKVTHVALNAPIALTTGSEDNIQRRPNLTPVHGSFGPFLTTPPTSKDFEEAFWVSTRQNGIMQTWAPLYTMFSRGNITEKARILALPSVVGNKGCSVVDLYAGIGYFAFSYARAGAGVVMGFELNAWSVEACRKGARENGWACSVVRGEEEGGDVFDDGHFQVDEEDGVRLLIYEMSNEHASGIVEGARGRLPPVRHVNLGLLPTSRDSWQTAVRCLDPVVGGWLHIHENFAVREIPRRAADATRDILAIARVLKGQHWAAELEHVERVKTYAPGVMHCVLDIHVRPS